MTSTVLPLRGLVSHAIGGGWGEDDPFDGAEHVAVIRGADIPAVRGGDLTAAPQRWEKSQKLPARVLKSGDIVLEISGGTAGRPTGRTVFVTSRLLSQVPIPVIPASFCRLVRVDPKIADPEYVFYWLQGMYETGGAWKYQNRSTGIANFQFEYFLDAEKVRLPSLSDQRAIASTLGVLDEKIESCRRLRARLREHGFARFTEATQIGSKVVGLADVTSSVNRGITPKYDDDNEFAPIILNQKCIRDGWVQTGVARRMVAKTVAPNKRAQAGDILVNSTGVGTLGRIGRWHLGEAFVDSHVTIVRPDHAILPPTVLSYAMLGMQSEIEAMATGSTGQTELSPARLGELPIRVPADDSVRHLEGALDAIENRIHQTFSEERRLADMRDLLIPELMSGRLKATEVPRSQGAAG